MDRKYFSGTANVVCTESPSRIPNTIKLVLPSYVTAFLLAIGLGLLSGTLVILGNLISDILCATIDPRIRTGR